MLSLSSETKTTDFDVKSTCDQLIYMLSLTNKTIEQAKTTDFDL